MPKFRIEMELQSINERILIANFDSENNQNECMTFDETLTENENDQFNLSFSIANKFGRTDFTIGSYISIGRPLWLHLDDRNKSIRMAITSFSTEIGAENLIYNVEAIDYASSMFSKNNVGLILDSFDSPDYLDFKKKRSLTDSNEVLANYILERGWLRKHISGTTYEGWSADFPAEQNFVNISVSGSNTYNALITIANSSFKNIEIDYENKIFYFIDRNDTTYETEYTLKNGFNLQNFSLNYSADNLYSLFYIEGGQDIDQNFITLSSIVEYKDNFLYNLDYFQEKQLIASNILTDNIQTLTDINKELSLLIGEKTTKEIQISDYKTNIRIEAEETIAPDGQENFIVVDNLFKTKDFGANLITVQEEINVPYEAIWISLDASQYSQFDFPIKINYKIGNSTKSEIIQNEGDQFANGIASLHLTVPTGVYETFTQDGVNIYVKYLNVEWGPYGSTLSDFDSCTSTTSSCKLLSHIGNTETLCVEIRPSSNRFVAERRTCQYAFKKENLSIDSITGIKTEQIDVETYPDIYPYFELLYEYDGEDAITNEQNKIEEEIAIWTSEWQRDYDLIQCIDGPWGSSCEIFGEEEPDSETKELLKEGALQRIKDYALLIGEYDPAAEELNANKLGILTLIQDRFLAYKAEFLQLITDEVISFETVMPKYRIAEKNKKDFWYNLKKDKQHIFPEGYYSNDVETDAESLLEQAEAVYSDHTSPTESFGITYIEASDLVGVTLQKLKVGQFIKVESEDYKQVSTSLGKIRIMSISRNLRENANINLQISRYNLYETIVEKIIQEQSDN